MTSAVAFADGVDACHEAASESVVGSGGKPPSRPAVGCPANRSEAEQIVPGMGVWS
jgi:hypothetical protein